MAQTVQDLMDLGLSETEATRVINRKAKADEKNAKSIETAEKRLPKIKEDHDHAEARAKHWADKAAELKVKVDKYEGIIAGNGESADDVDASVPQSEAQVFAETDKKEAAKKTAAKK